MESRTKQIGTSLVAMSLTMGLLATIAAGCRSAVDDFYKPLTAPPESSCGTGGAAGASNANAGSGGTGGTGGASPDCTTGGGGAH